ncbi:hypothetical protein Hanom_Chr06g00556861 [Helianthus anomalus]
MPFIIPKPTTAFSLQLSVIPRAFHISMDFLNQLHVKIHLLHLRLSFHQSISDFFSLIHIDICKSWLLTFWCNRSLIFPKFICFLK